MIYNMCYIEDVFSYSITILVYQKGYIIFTLTPAFTSFKVHLSNRCPAKKIFRK